MCRRHHDFFFQAEDGIRDESVTGVQTCALPISSTSRRPPPPRRRAPRSAATERRRPPARSEERRGGEERRFRGAPYHLKKKKGIPGEIAIKGGEGRGHHQWHCRVHAI